MFPLIWIDYAMLASLPDVYVSTTPAGVAFQGASERGIEAVALLSSPLINGTIVVLQGHSVEKAFATLDAADVHSRLLG